MWDLPEWVAGRALPTCSDPLTSSSTAVHRIQCRNPCNYCCLSSDGKYLACTSDDKRTEVFAVREDGFDKVSGREASRRGAASSALSPAVWRLSNAAAPMCLGGKLSGGAGCRHELRLEPDGDPACSCQPGERERHF